MMQYCLAWSILFVYSAKFMSQNFAGAGGLRYSCLSNVFVAVRTIIFWTSSPGPAGWYKTKALFAFGVDAIGCFNASISSSIIAFLLPVLAICWPDLFIVVNMSIKCLKGFYDDSSYCYFVVFDSPPVLSDPDEGSCSLTNEAPTSTYSDQPRKEKPKRVRFLYDSSVTTFRYKFGYPPWMDRSLEWRDRGWTHKYMVRLWQQRIKESSDTKCVKERDFWFSLGQACCWDSFWSLDVDRVWNRKQALPKFTTFSLCWFVFESVRLLLLFL